MGDVRVCQFLICDFDSSMEPYSHICEMDVSNNDLAELPRGICDMKANLMRLAADHNNLTTLPEFLTCLGKLEILSVQSNRINALPALAGLDSLKEMDLSNNKLEGLPDSLVLLPSLQRLDLRFNILVRQLCGDIQLVYNHVIWLTVCGPEIDTK